MYPIITISREVGSGGHAIGELVAQKLGVPFLDKDFIAEVAKATGMDQDEVQARDEYGSWAEKYMNSSFYNALYMGDPQDEIYDAQRDIILEQVKKGSCVIVGRCADYILQEEGIQSLNVFIHADLEHRLANFKVQNPDIKGSVEKALAKKDKGRRFYYRYYTDREVGDYRNYHLILDSGFLDEDTCAEIIVDTVKHMSEA